MRLLSIFLAAAIVSLISCQEKKERVSLDKAFIQSFKEGNFTGLEKFLPTKSFYKSLGKEMEERSDADIDSFLSRANQRLMNSWNDINQSIKEKQIDPSKIKLKESIVYNPFRESQMQGMVIVYEYDNKTWDDLSMIVRQQGDTTYLLEIPNPTRAFSFADSSLAESSQAKAAIELSKPGFKESLEKHVQQLMDWAKDGNMNEFGSYVVYHGEDENRSWKSAVNLQNAEEKELAERLINRVKSAAEDCSQFSFDTIMSDKESEGFWIVQPVKCGNKIIRFAFLKIRDKMMIGDIDVETGEE